MGEMWIVNVGDIKGGEYERELFMDMGWNMGGVEESGVRGDVCDFLWGELGSV